MDPLPQLPEHRPFDAGRRRLFRGAGGGAGVLLSVSAKSALGAVCQSPSAMMSGNTSPRPGSGSTCSGGVSPGYWKVPQHANSWPAAGGVFPTFNVAIDVCATNLNDISQATITNKGTNLQNVFPAAPDVSMWYVLYNPNDTVFGGKGQLLRHLSAAWLNAGFYTSSAAKYPLTKQQVIDMWNAVKMGGTYCPVGVTCTRPWTVTDVINYISGMYDLNALSDPPVCKK
jgi:hypothetical protein